MAQARVTDFYSRKKRGAGRTLKTTKLRSGSTTREPDPDQDQVLSSFVRVVDEAAGLVPVSIPDPGSPRTPKRTSVEAEFELGAAVVSTSPKKKRAGGAPGPEGGPGPEGATRRSARKKLLLSQSTVKAEDPGPAGPGPAGPGPADSGPAGPGPAGPGPAGPESRPSQGSHVDLQDRMLGGERTKTSRGDVASLQARLHRIKRRDQEKPSSSSSSSSSSETQTLRLSLSRAKELAARAQRRKEEDEENKQSEAAAQSSATPPCPELPAHQRYHSLALPASLGPVPAGLVPPGLVLPYAFKQLAEMFRNMDTVVAMLYNRSETATFCKIQRGVQDLMHRRFEENHVGQIKFVFPEAFTFRQQKNVPTFSSSVKRGSYQLTVEPTLVSDLKIARPAMSASLLLERRRVFHRNLLAIVKQHHQAFLSSLVPPLSVPEDRLTRWHPRFSVDKVAPPPSAALPSVPHTERAATAREVLEKTRSLFTPKMERALLSVALRTEDKAADSEEQTPAAAAPPAAAAAAPPPPAAAAAAPPAALRGVPQSLVDRIRAKEAQKLQAVLTRDPVQDQRLLMMSRLEELARILRSVFVAEKKPALTMEVVCSRLGSSYRSALSAGEMEKHVQLLAELVTDWLSIHPIRKDLYLKLNKGMELSTVLDRLRTRLQEEGGV